MMCKCKKAIDSVWARSKVFRVIIITIFLLLIAVPIFLLTIQAYKAFGYSFSLSLISFKFVIGYIAYKKGLIRHTPKQRRIIYMFVSGLVTSFAILIVWRELTGPLPLYSLLIFVLIFVAGAFLTDKIWKRLGVYNNNFEWRGSENGL